MVLETFNVVRITLTLSSAWPVNFGRSLGFFEPSIRGLRALIDFALTSPRAEPPRLMFMSSISVLRREYPNLHSFLPVR